IFRSAGGSSAALSAAGRLALQAVSTSFRRGSSMAQTATLHTRPEAALALSDRRLFRELSYIGGRWTAAEGAQSLDVLDPADGSLLGRVPALGGTEARAAVDAAHTAFPAWRRRLAKERGAL